MLDALLEGAYLAAVVIVTVTLWWHFVLKPRTAKIAKAHSQHVASASVEVRHTQEPRLRPMRILVVTNLPPLLIGDSKFERIRSRVGFEEIQDADYIVAIDTHEEGTVVKDRDGLGEDGWEVKAFTRRVING